MNAAQPQLHPYDKHVNLKLLYTFDDQNTFLARSASPLKAKIITLPNQPPHNGAQIGCVQLKECLQLLYSISPEWFQDNSDYSIYYKDIIEYGEPYVATGLCSNVINNKKSNILITGRLSTNLINLYQPNASVDTLDIKLRFSPIQTATKRTSADAFSGFNSVQQDMTLQFQHQQLSQQQYQHQQQQQYRKRVRKSLSNRLNDAKNIPQLASRTQSLPFITEDSLAHRIRLSDMMTRVDEEIDATGEPISSRFSNFYKSKFSENNANGANDNLPLKASKTKSFIQSVIKIGDNNVSSTSKKKIASINKNCINCMSNSNPPYKFFKDGIFEMGNSGFLCSTCTEHQLKSDVKLLRERGKLGSKGLLDDPYTKTIAQSNSSLSSSTTTAAATATSATIKRQRKKNIVSSSPFLSSSPMNFQNGFTSTKSKKQIQQKYCSTQKQHQLQLEQQIEPQILQPDNTDINNFNHDDLMDLLKLESSFGNYKMPLTTEKNQPTQQQLPHIDDLFRVPISYSKGNTPNDGLATATNNNNSADLYSNLDNIPIDAIKLNTTLIPLDDDDKENVPPQLQEQKQPSLSSHPININYEISPSIQHIIDSFSNEPSSPSKSTNDWNYDFFNQNIDDDVDDDVAHENKIKEMLNNRSSIANTSDQITINERTEIDDIEISNILNHNNNGNRSDSNNNEKYDITPRDPPTSQTQQNYNDNNDDREEVEEDENKSSVSHSLNNNFKITPNNNTSVIDIHVSSNTSTFEHPSDERKQVKNSGKSKKDDSAKSKKSRITMPSSPIFQFSRDDKALDTTDSLVNWDAQSSPVTDPLCFSETKP